MKKTNILIVLLVLIVLGLSYYAFVYLPQREDQKALNGRIASYQKECATELQAYFKDLDKFGPVLAKMSLENKKYIDDKGYIIGNDILVARCVEEKKLIFEKLYN